MIPLCKGSKALMPAFPALEEMLTHALFHRYDGANEP
jgi:hypothetical protein